MTKIKVPREYTNKEKPVIETRKKNYSIKYAGKEILIPKEFHATLVYQLDCLREEEKNATARVSRYGRPKKILRLRFENTINKNAVGG